MDATTFYAAGTPQLVELSVTLSYRDWCIVRKSREFHCFRNLLDTLEKQRNRSRSQESPNKQEMARF